MESPPARSRKASAVLKGVGIGAAVELPALLLGLMSAGAGHGDYVIAAMLFPVPLLLTGLTHGTIAWLAGSLALLQFPLYGALIARNHVRGVARPHAPIAATHIAAILLCFSGIIPDLF